MDFATYRQDVFRTVRAETPERERLLIAALGLSGPAGMAVSGTSVGADPRYLLGLWPALIRRDLVEPEITVEAQTVE